MPLTLFRSWTHMLAATSILFGLLLTGCTGPAASRDSDPPPSSLPSAAGALPSAAGTLPSAQTSEQPPPPRTPSAASETAQRTAPSQSMDFTAEVSPPFFRVRGQNGAQLDILGTIHLGPPGGWNLSRAVTQAMREADAFIMEIDLRSLDENEVGNLLASLVILPPGTTLDDVVSPETSKLLDIHEASLAEIGFPRNARRHKKPWYLVTSIISLDSQKSGFDLTQSVETSILEAAVNRPLLALETFEGQLRMMDGLSPRVQDIMLRDVLERRTESTSDIRALVDAWAGNDQAALAELAYQGVDEYPELISFFDALLKNRNRRWIEQLSEFLDDPTRSGQRFFVGVGALHLVGPDSVIALLRARGYAVQETHAPASTTH